MDLVLEHRLNSQDRWRVLRDLVVSQLAQVPGMNQQLGQRQLLSSIDLGQTGLNADSLTRVQLATSAATLFNTFDVGLEDLLLAKSQVSNWLTVLERAAQSGACDMTFSSSGTSGQKKHFRHADQTLWDEAHFWASQLSHIKRVVVMCPTHHIYGFIWGVLVPKALNVPTIELDQTQSHLWQPDDLIIGVPTQWEWLSKKFVHRALPAGLVGISSTSPMPDPTRHALLENGPSQFFEIYGSSETAGIGARAIGDEFYKLMDCRVRRNDDVFMCNTEDKAQLRSGALSIQDQINWLSADTFELGNRIDGVVQIGGHNVSPHWVVEKMTQFPAVSQSSVRLDSAATPARLKAFVVLNDTSAVAQFESWLAQNLPHYAMPHRITYGKQLPRNAIGKLADWV
jgi:long-chain acyl-CoA synthetase